MNCPYPQRLVRPPRPSRWVGRWAVGAALALSLAACGGDGTEDAAANQVDAEFASAMTQHHAQTLQLLNLPQTLRMDDRAVAWTDASRRERMTEIEELSALLREWGEPVPETGLDHASEGDAVDFDATIAGVLTPEEVAAVRRASGDAFAQEWFRALLEHERGALTLAQTYVGEGADPDAVGFAEQDVAHHAALIARLERLAGAGP